VLKRYGGSQLRLLQAVYPDHKWLPWKFQATRAGFWDDLANQRWFFEELMHEHNIDKLEGLYEVTLPHILKAGGAYAFMINCFIHVPLFLLIGYLPTC
jgi:hypothetical protein